MANTFVDKRFYDAAIVFIQELMEYHLDPDWEETAEAYFACQSFLDTAERHNLISGVTK